MSDANKEKTAWDKAVVIIQAIAPLAIVVSIAGLRVGAKQFNEQQKATAAQTLDQQRQVTLSGYLDHMSTLVLQNNLTQSKTGAPVRAIAVALTDTATRNLDGARKGTLIRYLWQAGLINRPRPVIGLFLMDLNRTRLRDANLFKAVMSHVSLSEADLTRAKLNGANLQGSYMRASRLISADLGCFHWTGDKRLTCADLSGADVSYSRLDSTVLVGANLAGARLTGADLTSADLSYFYWAGGKNADLYRSERCGLLGCPSEEYRSCGR